MEKQGCAAGGGRNEKKEQQRERPRLVLHSPPTQNQPLQQSRTPEHLQERLHQCLNADID